MHCNLRNLQKISEFPENFPKKTFFTEQTILKIKYIKKNCDIFAGKFAWKLELKTDMQFTVAKPKLRYACQSMQRCRTITLPRPWLSPCMDTLQNFKQHNDIAGRQKIF